MSQETLPTYEQRNQIHYLQNAIWNLEKSRADMVQAKCSTFVLGQLDNVITSVQEELNDVSVGLN